MLGFAYPGEYVFINGWAGRLGKVGRRMVDQAVPGNAGEEQGVRKAVLAGVIGNFVEWYEYGVYGYMAVVIATLFFPEGNQAAALLATYGAFAVSFLIRPLGGTLFGRFGDTVGRRAVLSIAILMMSGATACIGLLPTYATVGFLAPALLVLLRLVQGLAAGGEYVGAVSFVVEYGPAGKRAFYASWVSVSVWGGLLCGAGIAYLLTSAFGEGALEAGIWRVPFLLALPLGLVGLYLRTKVEETPAFRALQEASERTAQDPLLEGRTEAEQHVESAPVKEAFKTQLRPMLVYVGFGITSATGSYLFATYLVTYFQTEAGLSTGNALLANTIALFFLIPLLPLAGLLCDRIGRKPFLLAGCALFVALALPAYAVANQGTLLFAVLASLVLVIPSLFVDTGLTVSIAEMYPTRLRYTASGIAHNVAFGVFGGLSPLIATALVATIGTPLAVGYYMMGLAALSFIVVLFFFRETYRAPLGRSVYTDAQPEEARTMTNVGA